MTIEKGREWGRVVDERGDGAEPTGDMALELGYDKRGRRSIRRTSRWRELPVDVIDITCVLADGRSLNLSTTTNAVAGSRLRGPYCVISSTSFVGSLRLFDRSHPNDGRVESLCFDPAMGLRQRIEFGRRIRFGTHLPHPDVATSSADFFHHAFPRPIKVRVGPETVRNVREISAVVIPDGARVYVPVDTTDD